MKETIGQRIRRLRLARGIRFQSHLATQAGIPPETINQIEQGHREPRIETLDKLAIALGVTLDALVYGEGVRPAAPVAPLVDKPTRRAKAKPQGVPQADRPRPAPEPERDAAPAVPRPFLETAEFQAAVQGAADAALISLAHAIIRAQGSAKTNALRKTRRTRKVPTG